MSNTIDKYVIQFCQDSLKVLKKYNNKINHNLSESEYKEFYKYDSKGVAIYSITEPILKFIIFSELCKKYQIWPEGNFYNGKKLLDIGLFSKTVKNIEEEIAPDIAIEMKWGGIKKNGEFATWSLKNLVSDIYKLNKECDIKNKYLMQFIVIHSDEMEIDNTLLKQQLIQTIDKRKFRNRDIKFLYSGFFNTNGANENNKWKFSILLWKIA